MINRKMNTSFYTLRHTFANRLMQFGNDLFQVQRFLGHFTPIMTVRYRKLVDNNLGYAINVMEQKHQIEMQTEHRLRFLNDQKVEKNVLLKRQA
jgi:site-specific recombinase XerD